MKAYYSSDFRLGILGGGQLGKMLLTPTSKWDIYTLVLDHSDDAPCKVLANEFYKGDLQDYDTVYNFGKKVDVLTIEIEHVNVEALFSLEKEGVKVYPRPSVIKMIQDKGLQKDFYKEKDIPTSSYTRFQSLEELKQYNLTFPKVWKSATMGYDGNGVKVLKSKQDIDSLPDVACIVEDLVIFEKELAVIVARNPKGETEVYPVTEMEFHPEANQVEYVLCPANIDKEIAKKANTIALKVVHSMDHIGILAVEMFLTKEGDILVNESAPRTHNSGHHTIEASYTSQFEQQIRAILDLPLGYTKSIIPSVMINLVGEEGYSGDVFYENIEKAMSREGVTPHIYGKKQTRPFRKMGHVTIVNTDITIAREIAEDIKKTLKVKSK
ncbi:MAG: 5-(carboxyamino)imidazole ribonucleotide synthase [Flavobacteriaceae bacterium]|nr:5-(carboxyamino)imidazole ribonucleotide synthase [Flavobacteriaceae bacterium]